MESTPVVIVGAGPSGMTLGLTLAKYGIESTILEKEREVAHDPRGVVLNGDAVRIMYDLGLANDMPHVGHLMTDVQFHKGAFNTEPFYKIDLTTDSLRQALPAGILMSQPKLEEAMERLTTKTSSCDLRRGCTVETRQVLADGVIVTYKNEAGHSHSIRCAWLIGADGKTGIVRKHFLEKQAGIRQEEGIFQYKGTWIAANLRLKLPTPQTHPNLPFWSMGMTAQQVYDLYWPKGWHFCAPPGKPTAAGRFGKHDDRTWRHEFAVDTWDDTQDAEALLWEHITPMITRKHDAKGRRFTFEAVSYPRDCIEIWRCRPYTFVHKVVNKWFAGRTILIGDAAHVFPPFGGQGICSGIRDAHQLAWRLAVIIRCSLYDNVASNLLDRWARERRQGVDDAARLTEINGKLVNQPESLAIYLFRHMQEVRKHMPFMRQAEDISARVEAKGYKATADGFFLADLDGGVKIPQTIVTSLTGQAILSDEVLQRGGAAQNSLFTVLNLQHSCIDAGTQQDQVKNLIHRVGLSSSILDDNAVVTIKYRPQLRHSGAKKSVGELQVYAPLAQPPTASLTSEWLWERTAFAGRLPADAIFAVLRPDFYIYAVAKDLGQLEEVLVQLNKQLTN